MRVVWRSILLVCALVLTTTRADAARVRATLLVSSSKEDRALTERVRGQTSDLDAQIVVREAHSPRPTVEARIREADAIAAASAVDAVVWFRVVDGEVVIYAVMPAQDRLLVRSVAGGAGKPSSATLEAAALVVRNVIRALGEGATVGDLRTSPKEETLAIPLYVCASPLCAAPPLPMALATPKARPRASPTFLSAVGFQTVRARDAPSMMNALELRLGARYGWLSAAAVLTLGATDVERVTEHADILVRRHSLGLAAGATWALGRDTSVGLNLTAGALSFVRAARSHAPTLAPTETQSHVRMFIGPEARVAYAIASPLSVVVSAGLDLVVNTPRFEVTNAAGSSAVYDLAVAQPRVGIGLEWSSFKSKCTSLTVHGEIEVGRCADLSSSPQNCGACGASCTGLTGTNMDAACVYGRCEELCWSGWGDCNGNPRDGCETDLNADPKNCGTCGRVCDGIAGQACVDGQCMVEPCDVLNDGGGPTR